MRNQKLLNLTIVKRQELVNSIDRLQAKGIRLDPYLVAQARDSLRLHKPRQKPILLDEPTKEQINRMLVHFGKEPIK